MQAARHERWTDALPHLLKPSHFEKETRPVDDRISHADAADAAAVGHTKCGGATDVLQEEKSCRGVKERTLTDFIGVKVIGGSELDSHFGLSDAQMSQADKLSGAALEGAGDGARERALPDSVPSGRPSRDSHFGLYNAQESQAAALAEEAATLVERLCGATAFPSETDISTIVKPGVTLDKFLWEDTSDHYQQLDTTSKNKHHYEHVKGTLFDQEVGTPSTRSGQDGSRRSADTTATSLLAGTSATSLLSGENSRYDFGPGFMTKCSVCGKFTRNRGDRETMRVYCQPCFMKSWAVSELT
jgi:hypothetical protein